MSLQAFLAATGLILLAMRSAGAEGTLNNTTRVVQWSGVVTKAFGPMREVPECALGCQRFDMTVNLPNNVWKDRTGGLQIAIRWAGLTSALPPDSTFARIGRQSASARYSPDPANLGDNLKLYVYRGSSLIAKSDGITSLAQSVLIRMAPNGQLRIYVAYDPDSALGAIAYDGLADVEFDPMPKPMRRLLPDLEARAQRHLTFDPGKIFERAISPQYPSCYFTEVEEDGAHLCLRFDQVFANVGQGDAEVRFSIPNGSNATTFDSYQRIYWSDQAEHTEDLPAGRVEFLPTHQHYHVTSLGLSRLWSVKASPGSARPSWALRSIPHLCYLRKRALCVLGEK